jgi:hypothetical protein
VVVEGQSVQCVAHVKQLPTQARRTFGKHLSGLLYSGPLHSSLIYCYIYDEYPPLLNSCLPIPLQQPRVPRAIHVYLLFYPTWTLLSTLKSIP